MTSSEILLFQEMSQRISDVGDQMNEQRRQGDERYHELKDLLGNISSDLRVHRVTGNGDDGEDVQAAPERGRLRRKVLTREKHHHGHHPQAGADRAGQRPRRRRFDTGGDALMPRRYPLRCKWRASNFAVGNCK